MEELLDDLMVGFRAKELFNSFYQETFNVNSQDFSNLLLQLSEEFSVEIESIDYYFTSENNLLDEFDVIDPEYFLFRNLTWEMFRNRLKNFLVKVLGVAFEEERYNEALIENLAEDVFLVVSENIFRGYVEDIAVKLEEKFEKIRETGSGKSWISPYLVEYKEELMSIFEKNSVGDGMIEGNVAKLVLLSFLKMIRVSIEEKDVFLFDRMVENRFKQVVKANQVKYLKLSFSQFGSLIEEWAIKEGISQLSFEANLKATIKELIEINSKLENSAISPILSVLTHDLKHLSRSYHSKPENNHNPFIETKIKSLKEIFHFYARQIKMLSKQATFDEIIDHQSLLNISKFTKFCGDFGITSKQNKDHLSVQQATQAFLSGNDCSRVMNFSQFVDSLDRLAEIYYSKQHDERNKTSYAKLRVSEKRKLFYEFLQLDNKNEYMQRAKGFGLPFSKEKAGYRIPDYDLSKKYQFRDQSQRKEKIAEWKRTKNSVSGEIINSKPPMPSPARLAAVKNSLLQRKDRVTWDILKTAQHSSLLSKDDLSLLFTDADLKELLSKTKSINK